MKFKELIDELEEIIEDASKIPLSNKCMVDKEEVFNVVQQIRLAYPEDIKQAEYVKKERDRILQDAQKEAQIITEEARAKCAKMVDDSEIVRLAKQKAAELLNDAQSTGKDVVNQSKEQARLLQEEKKRELEDYQEEVRSYIINILQKTESASEQAVSTLAKSIDELNSQYDAIRSVYDSVAKNRMSLLNQE